MPSRALPSRGRSAGRRPPVGHRRPRWKLPVVCAVCAALPDIDLLYMPTHRTATHSVPVAVLLTILAVVVTGWVNPIRDWAGRRFGVGSQTFVVGLACGACLVVAHPAGLARRRRQSAVRRPGLLAFQRHVVLLGRGRVSGNPASQPAVGVGDAHQSSGGDLGNSADGIGGGRRWWIRGRFTRAQQRMQPRRREDSKKY